MLLVKACRNFRHTREIAIKKKIVRAPDKVRYRQVIIPDKGFDSVRFGVRKNRGYLFVIAFIFVFHIINRRLKNRDVLRPVSV